MLQSEDRSSGWNLGIGEVLLQWRQANSNSFSINMGLTVTGWSSHFLLRERMVGGKGSHMGIFKKWQISYLNTLDENRVTRPALTEEVAGNWTSAWQLLSMHTLNTVKGKRAQIALDNYQAVLYTSPLFLTNIPTENQVSLKKLPPSSWLLLIFLVQLFC